MSTAISMHSPHHSGSGAFASSLQLSPAFRSLHALALRQRQAEIERLRELARSDEFSDDESDGEDGDDDVEEQDDEDEEAAEEEQDEEEQEERRDVVLPPVLVQPSPRENASSDSDIDRDDTVLLPFVRPPIVHRPGQDLVSPRTDDWTLLDKSPTCEGLVYGNVNVTESWFTRP